MRAKVVIHIFEDQMWVGPSGGELSSNHSSNHSDLESAWDDSNLRRCRILVAVVGSHGVFVSKQKFVRL